MRFYRQLTFTSAKVAEPQQCGSKRTAFTLAEVPEALQHGSKRAAFTLAEVLITLGIIGVVAAVTLPTLIKDYQERAWATQSSVFSKKLTQALKVMNTQQVLAGQGTTENFVTELGKHIKIIQTCRNTELTKCFNMEANEIIDFDADGAKVKMDFSGMRTSADFGKEDWGTNIVGVVFGNGVTGALAYNPNCVEDPYNGQFSPTSCVIGLYDVSGHANPNTTNKDIRYFGDVALASEAALKFNGKYWAAPVHAASVSKAKCEELIGVGNCAWSSDAWAGAAIHCGGLANLPTKADLEALAPKLYKNSSPHWYYEDLIDRDRSSIFLDKIANTDDVQLFVIWGNTYKDQFDAAYLSVYKGSGIYYDGFNYIRHNGWESKSFALCRVK